MTKTPPINFRLRRNRALRAALHQRDHFTCQICGWKPRAIPTDYDGRSAIGWWPNPHEDRMLEVDHIVPRAAGGPSTMDNLQTLCDDCNRRKWCKVPVAA